MEECGVIMIDSSQPPLKTPLAACGSLFKKRLVYQVRRLTVVYCLNLCAVLWAYSGADRLAHYVAGKLGVNSFEKSLKAMAGSGRTIWDHLGAQLVADWPQHCRAHTQWRPRIQALLSYSAADSSLGFLLVKRTNQTIDILPLCLTPTLVSILVTELSSWHKASSLLLPSLFFPHPSLFLSL